MTPATPSPQSDRLRQYVTLAAILIAFAGNGILNAVPLNGQNVGEIANTLFSDVWIIPASYAFAIWGLIYTGLLVFGIYQVLPANRENPHTRKVGYWLAVACISQVIWEVLFQSKLFWLSVLGILGILVPLIVIYLRLEIGQRSVSRADRWFVNVPFSTYLSWIAVATVINVASALYFSNWDGWGISALAWTVTMILVSGAIAAVVAVLRRDIAYTLVAIWALIAIAVRQIEVPLIAWTAIGVAIGLGVLLTVVRLRYQNERKLLRSNSL